MPHPELDGMLRGGTLPHTPAILTDLLSIAWIGSFRVPPLFLRGIFGVSPTRVYRALKWLKSNNPEYRNITIDAAMCGVLPEGDVSSHTN